MRIVRRHDGASLKNLGKKWFAILKMQETKEGGFGRKFRGISKKSTNANQFFNYFYIFTSIKKCKNKNEIICRQKYLS